MSWWKVLTCIAFIIGCIVCFFIVRGDDYSLATLKTENGYVVDIRAPYNWEMTQPISCRVMKNKEIIFPLRMIGTTHNARILEFALIESKEELVAVLEKTHPSVILAIYDLKNHTA